MVMHGQTARFIEPMECLPVEKIPEGGFWTYELKLDGYRLEAVKRAGKVTLYSRRGTDLSQRFKYVTTALASLPDETVIDGEVVAFAGDRTSFGVSSSRFVLVVVLVIAAVGGAGRSVHATIFGSATKPSVAGPTRRMAIGSREEDCGDHHGEKDKL